jgi:hypothetical protein
MVALGKRTRGKNVHMECFMCFISSEMIELGKQYHSEFSGEMGYFLTGESQQLLYNYHSRESL